MADSEADDPSFTSPSSALSHYRTLCSSLQSQLQSAEDDLRDLRELQDELESELERFEEGERGMRGEVEGLREEREEWKSKYLSALSSHSSTITHMQKELESLRSTERGLRDRLREVEVDNDDLEGRERATSSSLADLEARYNKSLERIALLEEELVGKARLEEECQRARDELRDLNEELAITKSQLDSATARLSSQTDSNATPTKPPPRRRTPSPPASPQTPTIEFVQPTPIPSRTTPTASNASPSKLPRYDWTGEEVDGTVGSGALSNSTKSGRNGRGEGESEFGEFSSCGGRRSGRGRGDDAEFDDAPSHDYLQRHDELATIKSARLPPTNAIDSPSFTLRSSRLDWVFDSSSESVERLFNFDVDERDESSCVAYPWHQRGKAQRDKEEVPPVPRLPGR
ncbi:hypothetical protein NBRC10513_008253 [Rhodotorula toruloides]